MPSACAAWDQPTSSVVGTYLQERMPVYMHCPFHNYLLLSYYTYLQQNKAGFQRPETFELYLNVMLEFTKHDSQVREISVFVDSGLIHEFLQKR